MTQRRVGDVMTREVVAVREDTPYGVVLDLLVEHRVSAVPVVDSVGHVEGVVSEADLLRAFGTGRPRRRLFGRRRTGAPGRTAGDVMTSPAVWAMAAMPVDAAARRMLDAGVKRLPVEDDLGRLVGIVSRGDLLKAHRRADEEILADIENEVVRRFLAEDAAAVTVTVAAGAVTLDGRVDRRSSAEIAERLCRQVPGVVSVTSTLDYKFDDHDVHGLRLGSQVV